MPRIASALPLAVLSAALSASDGTPAAPPPPNIVVILADDLGYGDLGCYNDRSKIPTPRLDGLAGEGRRFLDAHSPSSVCSPTRYGLLTGRYAWRTGLESGVLQPWDPPLIEPGRTTLPGFLGANGYHTACVGKWHLGWDWALEGGGHVTDEFAGVRLPGDLRARLAPRVDFGRPARGGPTAQGFDLYFGDDVPNFPPYTFIEGDRVVALPTVPKPAALFGRPGPAAPGWDLAVVLPTLAQRAARYIEERARTPGQPFFLYLPLTAPHTPIAPSPHFIGKSEAGWYGDFVHEVDWTVGIVLDALERTGATDETIVIFTSDNGSPQRDGTDMHGAPGSVKARFDHDPSRPWRGMKGDIWEAGHRVPFVARWPGRIPARSVCDQPIVLTDLFRTIATLLDTPLPADAAEDSFDIGPALFARRGGSSGRDHLIHHSYHGAFAIRHGAWKLIRHAGSAGFTRYEPPEDTPPGQLYDLAADPAEERNLWVERPDVVEELSTRLDGHIRRGRTWTGRTGVPGE